VECYFVSKQDLINAFHNFDYTGVLPDNVQPIESKTSTDLNSSLSTSSGLASSAQKPSAFSSGEIAQESASPTAQTVQVDAQASSTQTLANAESKSMASETETQELSSTWQVGISPSAYAASSASPSGPAVQPTGSAGYGGLGSLIWSGLSGSLPTDNSAGNPNLGGSSGYFRPSADNSDTAPTSGQSGSTILTGYTVTSLVVVAPTNGFGPGTGVGTGIDSGATSHTYGTQTRNSQETPVGSGSSAIYSPKYSFSWKFNTSTTRGPVGTSSKASRLPLPLPSPYGSDNATNATCGGITVNIPNATLDYWYATTLDYAAATFSIQFDSNDSATGWTLVPATTTFNVTDA
ncbi:hypothetical protein KCU72_g18935, partial [Aureobasidium melanogenum]